MKKGFNVFLTIVLITLIGALGFFSYKLFFSEDKVLVPDFSNKTQNEVQSWCNSLKNNPCSFQNEFNDEVPVGSLIYQSIAADEELGDSIIFVFSMGQKIEINVPKIDEQTTKDTIETWRIENFVKNQIEYIEESNDSIEKGSVIRIEPSTITDSSQIIKVYISSGEKDSKEEKEETIEVEAGKFTNISEDDFKVKTKNLNLVAYHKESKDAYSSTIEKGKIVWHGSGYYVKDETINYGLSLGKKEGTDEEIEITKDYFVGKTYEDFEKEVKELGLTPEHSEVYSDSYSDTIAKGSIDWHGSGTYEKDEVIHYTLSLGKKDGTDTDIVITKGQYVGKTFEEFKKIVTGLGLVAEHSNVYEDEYSDTLEKDCVDWHGQGTYVKGEKIHYTLSLGKKDSSDNKEIIVTKGQYVGKTLEEFEKIVKELGLIPEHSNTYSDDYSDTVAKGSLDWHGQGTYVKGEKIHYTLSLGKKESSSNNIVVTKGQFVGKTLDEFRTICATLGLKPEHSNTYSDDYSDTIAKGSLDWHGQGTYVTGEVIHYTLSLGKKDASSEPGHVPPTKTVTINADQYTNLTVEQFKAKMNELGLTANYTANKDANSSIDVGKVCWHNSGTFDEGSSISYGISKGIKTATVLPLNDLITNNINSTYDATKTAITNYFVNTCGFSSSNVSVTGELSTKAAGIIISISINEQPLNNGGNYPIDSKVNVVISTGFSS